MAIERPEEVTTRWEILELPGKREDFAGGRDWRNVTRQLRALEKETGRKFGDPENPLIITLEVRSREDESEWDALVIGINNDTIYGLSRQIGEEARRAYFRQISGFSCTVYGIPSWEFTRILDLDLHLFGAKSVLELPSGRYGFLVGEALSVVRQERFRFPQNLEEQIFLALAVLSGEKSGPKGVDLQLRRWMSQQDYIERVEAVIATSKGESLSKKALGSIFSNALIPGEIRMTEDLAGKKLTKKVRAQHSVWSLSFSDKGYLDLRIRNFSVDVADLDGSEDWMAVISFYPDMEMLPHRSTVESKTGERVFHSRKAFKHWLLIINSLFYDWGYRYQFSKMVPALSKVFSKLKLGTPVVEGISRIEPDGSSWCRVSGISIR